MIAGGFVSNGTREFAVTVVFLFWSKYLLLVSQISMTEQKIRVEYEL